MPEPPKSRLYQRAGRYWADFRDYANQGGKREPLKPKGERLATTDRDVAAELVAARIKELEKRRRNKALLGIEHQATLAEYAERHLMEKARSDRVTTAWMAQAENHLEAAVRYFGEGRDLASLPAMCRRTRIGSLRSRTGAGARSGPAPGGSISTACPICTGTPPGTGTCRLASTRSGH